MLTMLGLCLDSDEAHLMTKLVATGSKGTPIGLTVCNYVCGCPKWYSNHPS